MPSITNMGGKILESKKQSAEMHLREEKLEIFLQEEQERKDKKDIKSYLVTTLSF